MIHILAMLMMRLRVLERSIKERDWVAVELAFKNVLSSATKANTKAKEEELY